MKTTTLDSSPERYTDRRGAKSFTSRGKKRVDLSSNNSTAATALHAGKRGLGYFSRAEINQSQGSLSIKTTIDKNGWGAIVAQNKSIKEQARNRIRVKMHRKEDILNQTTKNKRCESVCILAGNSNLAGSKRNKV